MSVLLCWSLCQQDAWPRNDAHSLTNWLLEASLCQVPSTSWMEGLKNECLLAWVQDWELPSVTPGPSQALPGRGCPCLPTLPLPGQMMASSRVTRLARSSS